MSERAPIRVMIVDDHPLVRDGLRLFLLSDLEMELVAEAGSGEEAVRLCDQVAVDIVLMDLKMPGMGGVEATRAIRRRCPAAQVIALTSFAQEELVQEVMKAGAISYLLKDVSAEDLAEAIRAAHVGRSTLSPPAAQVLFSEPEQERQVGHDLSPRELEVLSLLIGGLTNAEIGQRLGISSSTVNFHMGNILQKLGASNRTEAVILAVEHRLHL